MFVLELWEGSLTYGNCQRNSKKHRDDVSVRGKVDERQHL